MSGDDGSQTVSSDHPVDAPARVSRRGFLGALGAGGAGLAVGGAAGYAVGHAAR